MEKAFFTTAWLYRCDSISWWNDGTERKPSKKYFDALQWKEVPNKNMKWLSIFNLELTVPVEYEFNFFRLSYTSPKDGSVFDQYEYYYVEKELSRTSKNKTLLLTIDIWCTYLISDTKAFGDNLFDMNVQTNRYLQGNDNSAKLSNLKKIYSYGFPTHRLSSFFVSWSAGKTTQYDNFILRSHLRYNSHSFLGFQSSPKINISNFYKYYVFLSNDPIEDISNYYSPGTDPDGSWVVRGGYRFVKNNSKYIVAIPVLFDWVGNLAARRESSSPNDRFDFQNGGNNGQIDVLKDWQRSAWELQYAGSTPINKITPKYYLFNDEENLIRLAERINQHKNWTGLSKFLGVFYGEHFLKLANFKLRSGDKVIFSQNDKNFEQFVDLSSQHGTARFSFRNFQLMSASAHIDNNFKYDKVIFSGFACVHIPYDGLDISDMGEDYGKSIVSIKQSNRHILGHPDYDFHFGDNKLYFTDRFVVSNGYTKFELDSEVPLILDDYYNVLQATKPQRDAALRTAAGNLATSAVRDWLPPAIHGNGVFAEKTAWGDYWEDVGTKHSIMGSLKRSVITPFSVPQEKKDPFSKIDKYSAVWEKNVLSQNFQKIGSADKLMGKTSLGLGIASSVANVIGSSIQFANTVYGLKKQQEQIRLQTSSSLTSTSASFLDKKFFFDKKPVIFSWNSNENDSTNREKLYKQAFGDIFYGYEYQDKYNLSSYYGQEMFYTDLNIKIKDLDDGWIVMSDGEMLFRKIYKEYRYKWRNETIQAIVQMLTQGVRVQSQP